MIILKDYQQTAVKELLHATKKLLPHTEKENKTIVFKAPTGSGKTLMVATYIRDLLQKAMPGEDICFLWVSIGSGNLHQQSAASLARFFGGDPAVSIYENEYTNGKTRLDSASVAVVNWEKLRSEDKTTGKWKNKVMREAGDFTNFIEMMQNTHADGAKIVLIIDESHKGYNAEQTTKLRQIIAADLTLEVSATPTLTVSRTDELRNQGANVEILPEWVIEAGMIKRSIPINADIDKFDDKTDDSTSERIILEAARARRETLKQQYFWENVRLNPLVLVQVSDGKEGDAKRESIEKYLENQGITTANGRLAVWLSDSKDKINLDGITDANSGVEFLIFKQAVATGWDCPRAQVLVMFRDIKSKAFKIQTVGRILRMPEQKHYATEDLNRGYVFTNLYPLSVEEEAGEPTGLLLNVNVKKRAGLENVSLVSYYRMRADFNDLTSTFYAVQNRVFCEAFGLETDGFADKGENLAKIKALGMDFSLGRTDVLIGKDGQIDTADLDEIEPGKTFEMTEHAAKLSDSDVEWVYKRFLNGFLGNYNRARSLPFLLGALDRWFERHFDYSPRNGGAIAVQHLVLRPENKEKIAVAIQKSIDEYEPVRVADIEKKSKDKMNPRWQVPETAQFSDVTDEQFASKFNFYDVCWLSKDRSKPERSFENWLEKKPDKIEWWYKNGEGKETYFGVQYADANGVTRTFYPDYLVKLKNGTLGIFDTKDGSTAEAAKHRAEALQRYFREFDGNGEKGLFGGILVERESGVWMLNQQSEYVFNPKDWTGWDFLEDCI